MLVLVKAHTIPCIKNDRGNIKTIPIIINPLASISEMLSMSVNAIIDTIIITNAGNKIVITLLFFIK